MIGIHDNTAANRRNPDPKMWVGFGERSVDDMLQVWINVVYLDDAGVPATGGGENEDVRREVRTDESQPFRACGFRLQPEVPCRRLSSA